MTSQGPVTYTSLLAGERCEHCGLRLTTTRRPTSGLTPHQLRIATQIARAPEENAAPNNTTRRPEMARVENGAIQVFSV